MQFFCQKIIFTKTPQKLQLTIYLISALEFIKSDKSYQKKLSRIIYQLFIY